MRPTHREHEQTVNLMYRRALDAFEVVRDRAFEVVRDRAFSVDPASFLVYRVVLTFNPNQRNPARASGRGVYRVVEAHTLTWAGVRTEWHAQRPFIYRVKGRLCLYLDAPRLYKRGSRVDPRKVLGI